MNETRKKEKKWERQRSFFFIFLFFYFLNFILADQLPPLFKHFIHTQFYNLTQPVIFWSYLNINLHWKYILVNDKLY